MKKVLVLAAAAAALAFAAPASAADMPVKGPLLAPAPAYSWNGFYVGVHVGYAWANRRGCFDFASTSVNCGTGDFDDTFDYQQSGLLGGGQIGYNWMFTPNWLIGVEADVSAVDIKGTLASTPLFGTAGGGTGKWNYLATTTAKIGWTNGPWLLFAKGGWAFSEFQFAGNVGCSFKSNHSGPLAGLGVATKLTPRASVSLEYDHIWFDTTKNNCFAFGFIPVAVETKSDMDVIKLRLNVQLGN
jgi:outer membrane immunogenic protein